MRVIAVANQKGGACKTTTVCNLGAALAERGRSVLAVDLDPQAQLTKWLGASEPSVGMGDVFMALGKRGILDARYRTQWERLDVVASEEALSTAPWEIATRRIPEQHVILKKAMAVLRPDEYDYVLLDCPPNSRDLLTVNAMVAAQEVLIPVCAEVMVIDGLAAFLGRDVQLADGAIGSQGGTIDELKGLNPGLKVSAIVPCRYARTVIARESVAYLRSHPRFGPLTTQTVIRASTRMIECYAVQPILAYDPRGGCSEDYRALAKEIEGER